MLGDPNAPDTIALMRLIDTQAGKQSATDVRNSSSCL